MLEIEAKTTQKNEIYPLLLRYCQQEGEERKDLREMVLGSFQNCTLVFNPRHNVVDMSDPSVSLLTKAMMFSMCDGPWGLMCLPSMFLSRQNAFRFLAEEVNTNSKSANHFIQRQNKSIS